MIPITNKTTLRNQIDSIPISNGTLIYCTDTEEVFYDYSNGVRGSISCEVLPNEVMRIAIPETKRRYDALYYVILTNKFYIMSIYTNTFIEVKYVEEITSITGEIIDLSQGFLHNEIKYFAPFTTSSSIVMSDSLTSPNGPFTLQDYINDGRLSATGFGVGLRTKHWTLNVTDKTKYVIIEYPVANYRTSGFDFLMFRNSMFVPANEYTVNENVITLIDEDDYFEADDLLTFVFTYSIITNPGSALLSIEGERINEGSVDTTKLSDSIIELSKEGTDDEYIGCLDNLTDYYTGLKINVSIDEEDSNNTDSLTININGLGDTPVELEEDTFPVGLFKGIITLIYTSDNVFKIVSRNTEDKYEIIKDEEASSATQLVYRLYKNNEEVGDPIEIPIYIDADADTSSYNVFATNVELNE